MAGKESIAVIGAGELAHDVVRGLVAHGADRTVVVISTTGAENAAAHSIDPSSASCSRDLAEMLAAFAPTTIVLLGLSQSPVVPANPWNADAALVDVLLSALDRFAKQGGREPALLFLSSTAVYGVAASSPLIFDERTVLPRETVFSSAHARWAQGLRTAERRLVSWAVACGVRVGVLRAAATLGGPLSSPFAELLQAPVPVRVLGYDPPCQVIHYDDLVDAVVLAVEQQCGEVLNLVGRAVVPLSRLLAMAGVFAPPLVGPLADRLAPAGIDGDHLRWRTIADGRRATTLLGFRPQKSLEDCFRAPR